MLMAAPGLGILAGGLSADSWHSDVVCLEKRPLPLSQIVIACQGPTPHGVTLYKNRISRWGYIRTVGSPKLIPSGGPAQKVARHIVRVRHVDQSANTQGSCWL
jgi:hypothetical protein